MLINYFFKSKRNITQQKNILLLNNTIFTVVFLTLCLLALPACTKEPSSEPTSKYQLGGPDDSSTAPEPLAVKTLTGFDTISQEFWNQTAVRKVLNIFAFGGHATDHQIHKWADMRPDLAIVQILTFDQHNLLLSPMTPGSDDVLNQIDGTMTDLGKFWASYNSKNKAKIKEHYDLYNGPGQLSWIWIQAATTRGLNPFRQKIGLWETNYHLVANHEVVTRRVMASYYDSIMLALEADLPYQKVLAVAAKSAAIAIQYDHRNNYFINDECFCNEDFAREFHQLFFGVLGINNPDYHEMISIKNTASALTDILVEHDYIYGGPSDKVVYGIEKHAPGALEVSHASIGGNNAEQRINELSEFAIEHPESLANLPVKIISGLADDNLNETKISNIQMAWQSMNEKKLLDFLHAYAISTMFHDSSRIKYRTSIDRQLLIANHITLNNDESYFNLYDPKNAIKDENTLVFFPAHNVFGGQTGEESVNSDTTFKSNYSNATEKSWRYTQTTSDLYVSWEKNWASVIPQIAEGYIVSNVTEWLWQRFIADNLKNLGLLERAHLYALLATGTDLAYHLNPEGKDRTIKINDIQTDTAINTMLNNLAQQTLALNSSDNEERLLNNHRIGLAINFIIGTPFLFVEVGN